MCNVQMFYLIKTELLNIIKIYCSMLLHLKLLLFMIPPLIRGGLARYIMYSSNIDRNYGIISEKSYKKGQIIIILNQYIFKEFVNCP